MKEKKLKIWDRQHKRFLEISDWYKDSIMLDCKGNLIQFSLDEDGAGDNIIGDESVPDDKRYEVVLHTGDKDKAGKDIYEGTVVEGMKCNELIRGEVVWSPFDSGFKVKHARGESYYLQSLSGLKSLTVIGDKYNNPELLNKESK